MSIKILILYLITCLLLLTSAIERQHYSGVTVKDCGLAKGSKCQHKHVFACHKNSCSMNFYRKNATQGEIPWIANVFVYGRKMLWCTGSVLSERWVLTAAHCLNNVKPNELKVFIGEVSPLTSGSQTYDVKQIRAHHLYKKWNTSLPASVNLPATSHDIALFELSRPIAFGHDICPVCLPPAKFKHGEKETALFAGYGPYDGTTYLCTLKTGWLTFNRSHIYNNPFDYTKDNQGGALGHLILVWRTPPDTGFTTCQSDSGGPLVQFDKEGRAVLIGIMKGVDSKINKRQADVICEKGIPEQKDIDNFEMYMMFVRVALHVQWIEEQIIGRKNVKRN